MVLQIFRALRRPAARREAKASAAAPVVAFQGAGRAAWSARDTATLTRVGFLGNPVAFRCVKIIAEAAAAVPVVVQDADRRFDAHPVLDLLAAPNPGQGGAALMESFYGHLLLSGDGYLEAAGEVAVRRAARALRAALGPDEGGAGAGRLAGRLRVQRRAAQKHVFDMRQDRVPVLHVKSFHPQDDHYGLSPLHGGGERDRRAQLGEHLVEGAARQRGAAVGGDRLQGRGRAGGAGARTSMRGWSTSWRRTTRGRATPGGRCCSRAGSTGSRWGSRRRDMEFHRTKEAAARDVALAFGVPPMLLGLPGDNTYANYQEAHRAFYRLTVLPLVAKTLAAMSGWLPAFYGAAFQVKVDDDNVPALAEEREALWRRITAAGFLSDAREAALLGLPKLQEG